ncbi:hypothetical protein L6Q21_09710 [Sandaracinobacter sp. RS1-74]|uniref:hypothetical protein n=1 Tax=Sandaracinobacteroides sayramensis TaxID=2913411 RepID=UPI001EDA35A1|nr:hypothetical protein [Sandaracinobacteroides sayramensis]MCG2841255.1 hypothetical protein [Sandaracinobacteroides sayramensis]
MTGISTAERHYVLTIRDKEDGLLFWNNEDGFGSLESADIYSDAEAREQSMPIACDRPEWLVLPANWPPAQQDGDGPVSGNDASPPDPARARVAALDTAFHALSDYICEHCPEDEHFEDFDPEIDTMRSEIEDILRVETEMLAANPPRPTRFVVEIQFLSAFELFATETYTVEAIDWPAAKCLAFALADDSPYNNGQIPDLTRRAIDHTP